MLSSSEKKAVEQYLRDLAELTAERNALEERMQRTEMAARSILAMTDDDSELMPYFERLDDILQPVGFTDAIRKVLRSSNSPLSPTEVKEKLSTVGFFLAGYSNPSASVHTILKRLAKTESVEASQNPEGRTTYEWVGIGRGLKAALTRVKPIISAHSGTKKK